jgi:predicted CoA-binding protein
MPLTHESDETISAIFEQCKTIAVIGLSPDESKPSHKVAKYLQQVGYRIMPVYPKGGTILGERVYPSLGAIEEPVDMVDMFRKPEVADGLLDEAIERGDVKAIWLQQGIVNNAAHKRAVEAGLWAVQNRCAMIEHQRVMDPKGTA